jgi:hypothetical protein
MEDKTRNKLQAMAAVVSILGTLISIYFYRQTVIAIGESAIAKAKQVEAKVTQAV